MAPLVYILGGLAAGLLGYKVFADQSASKPQPQPQPQPSPFPTPGFPTSPVNPGTFPNFPGVPAIPTAQPYQPGQKVKVSIGAMAGLMPASMSAAFQSVGAQALILQVITSDATTVTGTILSTLDSQGSQVLLPPGIPSARVMVPIQAVTPL